MSKSLINMEDKELMLLYQKDDHLAFEALYMRHKGKIYSYLKRRLHHTSDVDDLYQKVLLKLHKSRGLYDSKYDVLPWFYTITKSVLLDFFKLKKVDFESFEENDFSIAEQKIDSSFDIDKEKQLSAKEKDAIKLRYLEESDFLEISKLLKTSESNVRKLVSRGLKKLKTKYSGGEL